MKQISMKYSLLLLGIILLQFSMDGCSPHFKSLKTGKHGQEPTNVQKRIAPICGGRDDCGQQCPCELITAQGCQPCCNCSSCRYGYWDNHRCKWPCFPSEASIKLTNGKSVRMSELQIGDHVPTVSSDGSLAYSKVIAFMKKVPSMISMYKSITTSLNETIRISGNHLIYIRKYDADMFYPQYADEVSIGDEVLVQRYDGLIPAKVTKVFSSQMQGAYIPLTMEGNIVVDDVLASCYAFSDHDLAHFSMTPILSFPEITEWIFGMDKEYQAYASILDNLFRWLASHGMIYGLK